MNVADDRDAIGVDPHAVFMPSMAVLRGKVLVADAGNGLSINGRGRAALQRSAHMHEFRHEALFERHFLKVVVLQASSNSPYPKRWRNSSRLFGRSVYGVTRPCDHNIGGH